MLGGTRKRKTNEAQSWQEEGNNKAEINKIETKNRKSEIRTGSLKRQTKLTNMQADSKKKEGPKKLNQMVKKEKLLPTSKKYKEL